MKKLFFIAVIALLVIIVQGQPRQGGGPFPSGVQQGGSFIGNGAGLTNLAAFGFNSNTVPFVTVSSRGIANSLSGVTNDGALYGPEQSLTNFGINLALRARTNAVVILAPGTYNIGTNIIVMPDNTTLIGYGATIKGYADEAGVEDGYAPSGGPQIHAGNNCLLEGFTLTFDTNSVIALVDLPSGDNAKHSGTWGGIGNSSLNPPSNLNSTNVIIKNVTIHAGWGDCLHYNQTGADTVLIDGCFLESGHTALGLTSFGGSASNSVWRMVSTIISISTNCAEPASFAGLNQFAPPSTAFFNLGALGSTLILGDNLATINEATKRGWAPDGTTIVIVSGGSYRDTTGNRNAFFTNGVFGFCRYNGESVSSVPINFSTNFIGDGSSITNITPVITNFTTYASGTAYTLTGTSAALDFGTTDPILTINKAGTYLIQGNVGVKYNGATYAGAQTVTFKFRRTNNTAADLSNGSRAVELPVLTTFTGGDVMALPPVIYTATSGDIVTVFGILSAVPAAGAVLADSAEIVAIRLY